MANFNKEFGDVIVSEIKPVDLENYQAKRKAEGLRDATVDRDAGAAHTIINKAFDNDMVGGNTLRTFKKVKKLLKRNANARTRVLSADEYHRLVEHCSQHVKSIVAMGYYTGMRLGEILELTWDKVDLETRIVRLEAEDTKDGEPRNVPIPDRLLGTLKAVPRNVHDTHVFLYAGRPVNRLQKH